MISVIVPTIDGREDFYVRCVDSYRPLVDSGEAEIITEYNRPSAGVAWQKGAERASGDYIHLTCDDQVAWPGWHTSAIEAVEAGFVPAACVYGPNGDPQSRPRWGQELNDWERATSTTIPFCSREQWEKIGPLFTAHYYTDDFFSWRAIEAGWHLRVRRGYKFTHLWAQHGRGAGLGSEDARLKHDCKLFDQAKCMVANGAWTEPWPEEGR